VLFDRLSISSASRQFLFHFLPHFSTFFIMAVARVGALLAAFLGFSIFCLLVLPLLPAWLLLFLALAVGAWLTHAIVAYAIDQREAERDREERWSKFEKHVAREKEKLRQQAQAVTTSEASKT
jgi:fatty acid desaturase